MEKNYTKIRNFALVLFIILIAIVAFVGVYTKKFNVYSDIIPEYKNGMDFEGYVELKYKISDKSEEKEVWVDDEGNIKGFVPTKDEESEEKQGPEEAKSSEEETNFKKEKRTIKENEDNVLNKESYIKTKKIIEKRLREVGVPEYNIHLDNSTGNLTIDMVDTNDVTKLYQLITSKGELNIIDSQNGVILLGSEHIKKASSVYGQARSGEGYQVYLQVIFDKEGKELLRNISKNYVETKDSEGNSNIKYIEVQLDGQTIAKTYFDGEMGTGEIQIPIGSATSDNATFTDYLSSTSRTATIIDSGTLDNIYALTSDTYVVSRVSDYFIRILKIVACATLALIVVVFTIKFKGKGLLAGISNVGFISLLTIMIRYTNVTITFNSLIILFMLEVLNIIFLKMLIKKINSTKEGTKVAYIETMKNYYLAIIPVMIFAIVFTFVSTITVGTIGMIAFWGIFVQLIYNVVITRTLYLK